MATTKDIAILRVGVVGLHEPLSAQCAPSTTYYDGTIALLSGSTGLLKNADAGVASTDVVVGIIDGPDAGTAVKFSNGTTTTAASPSTVWMECKTGIFLLPSGSGADQLSTATNGKTVYVIDSTTVGLTNGGGTRPVAGIQLPADPTVPAGLFPIKLARPAS